MSRVLIEISGRIKTQIKIKTQSNVLLWLKKKGLRLDAC
jgi:hypothetical protein